MFDTEGKKESKNIKMMQINVVDAGGKLNINVRKKGFTPAEAIGVMEVAKQQILSQMGMKQGAQGPLAEKDGEKKG